MAAWRQIACMKPADYWKFKESPTLVDATRICDPRKYSRKLRHVTLGLGGKDGPA